jgi:hypothetical protein
VYVIHGGKKLSDGLYPAKCFPAEYHFAAYLGTESKLNLNKKSLTSVASVTSFAMVLVVIIVLDFFNYNVPIA